MRSNLLLWGIFMAFFLISTPGFGQQALVNLNSVFVTISRPGDDARVLAVEQALNDTAGTGEWVQLNVRIDLSDAAQLGSIVIEYGSQRGGHDILLMNLESIPVRGNLFLVHGRILYPITNNRVLIDRLIPAATLQNQGFLRVSGKDKNGTNTNVLVRNNIL